ncbi:hypothetical protein [Choristoneura rosaceana nucleopolyhedrovirus]|uniref:Uncharacterized protein n=1 Tax=Choristoneura rosaceana nucleopolyhedrovirus TaxID=58094 RepID=S5MRB0_9ABAC|nr:hypothetical protein [Choristoneura rosaceana nucleopolyhedrovirus]AGR57114.1 hypothetical protein [Choristoneura rosaceana nucleopolyhedrovirus]
MSGDNNESLTTVAVAIEKPHRRTLRALQENFTVDGLRLKPAYVEYYKQLQEIVELSVIVLSKQLNIKEMQEVYSLGRQLYEILRGLFVDEPFKLWLEANAARLAADAELKKSTHKILQDQLQTVSAKTNTFKNEVLNVLNNELICSANLYDVNAGYIKPNCIVLTFTCCDLTFEL